MPSAQSPYSLMANLQMDAYRRAFRRVTGDSLRVHGWRNGRAAEMGRGRRRIGGFVDCPADFPSVAARIVQLQVPARSPAGPVRGSHLRRRRLHLVRFARPSLKQDLRRTDPHSDDTQRASTGNDSRPQARSWSGLHRGCRAPSGADRPRRRKRGQQEQLPVVEQRVFDTCDHASGVGAGRRSHAR